MRLLTALVVIFAVATAGSGMGGGGAVPSGTVLTAVDGMLPAGYRNPRAAEQAVTWALSQVGVARDSGYCLRFVDLAFGRTSGPPSAFLVWTEAPAALRNTAGVPPRGSLVVWSPAIGDGHGHIAISLGDGTMVTTTDGAVAVRPIRGYADAHYYGWMPPYFYV